MNKSYIYVVLTILLWGSATSIGKLLLKELQIATILFYSFLFALPLLYAIIHHINKQRLILHYLKTKFVFLNVMSILGITGYYFLFYRSLQYISAQETYILNATWSLWIILFSIFILKTNLNWKVILSSLLGFFGVVLIIYKDNFSIENVENGMGYIFALGCGVFYGLFSVFGKKVDMDKTVSVFIYYFLAFIYITIYLFFNEQTINILIIDYKQLIGLLWLGTFCSGCGYLFWLLAIEHGDIVELSNIILLTPFVTIIYIYFILGETILFSSILGLIFIIFGILLQSKKRAKKAFDTIS